MTGVVAVEQRQHLAIHICRNRNPVFREQCRCHVRDRRALRKLAGHGRAVRQQESGSDVLGVPVAHVLEHWVVADGTARVDTGCLVEDNRGCLVDVRAVVHLLPAEDVPGDGCARDPAVQRREGVDHCVAGLLAAVEHVDQPLAAGDGPRLLPVDPVELLIAFCALVVLRDGPLDELRGEHRDQVSCPEPVGELRDPLFVDAGAVEHLGRPAGGRQEPLAFEPTVGVEHRVDRVTAVVRHQVQCRVRVCVPDRPDVIVDQLPRLGRRSVAPEVVLEDVHVEDSAVCDGRVLLVEEPSERRQSVVDQLDDLVGDIVVLVARHRALRVEFVAGGVEFRTQFRWVGVRLLFAPGTAGDEEPLVDRQRRVAHREVHHASRDAGPREVVPVVRAVERPRSRRRQRLFVRVDLLPPVDAELPGVLSRGVTPPVRTGDRGETALQVGGGASLPERLDGGESALVEPRTEERPVRPVEP